MTAGRIVFTVIGCLILALISGIITRNIIIAILFPILLVAFLLMWANIKKQIPKEVKEKEEDISKEGITDTVQPQGSNPMVEENKVNQSPPISTNYPRRPM
jgi:predicted membrane protein